MSSEQRRFSKREWWLIILVVVIAEYIFLDKVFKYGATEGIVSYVSFAGTIISIVLAVLAIVYSYYQNFSQQRDSNNIATQIDLLRTTVNDVRVSKNEFTKELERINEISDKLDQSISIVTESKTHVSQLSSEFIVLKTLLEKSTSQDSLKENNELNLTVVQIRNLFHRCSRLAHTVLYSIHKSQKEESEAGERYKKYYWDPVAKDFAESKITERMLYGMYMAFRHLFRVIGFLNEDGNNVSLTAEIEKLIIEEAEKVNLIESDVDGSKKVLEGKMADVIFGRLKKL